MILRPSVWLFTACSFASLGCGSDFVPPPGNAAADAGADAVSDAGFEVFEDARVADVGVDSGGDAAEMDADASVVDVVPDAVEPEPPLAWADPAECAVDSCDLGECDPIWGTCRCPAGTFFSGLSCMLLQRDVPDECIINTAAISPIAASETLALRSAGPFETAVMRDVTQLDPESWSPAHEVSLTDFEGSRIRVLARPLDSRCADYQFNRVFDVRATYPGAAEESGSDALPAESVAIVAWASVVENYTAGGGVIEEWRDSSNALGPAEGNSFDIVSLGEGGTLTVGFEQPISDGLGADFVLFENSFSDTFLEFAFVEISSDGETFVRFDSASQTRDAVGQFGGVDPEHIGALGGKYRQGWGTPYDLGALRQRREVVTGELELMAIRYVRLVDVVGDGTVFDSFGRPIYDPTPTAESTGFDVDAIGVLHVAEAQ